MTDTVTPSVWAPIKLLFGECNYPFQHSLICAFMYMGSTSGPHGIILYLYKHITTRMYLNLSIGGDTYRYDPTVTEGSTYTRVPVRVALAHVLPRADVDQWERSRTPVHNEG
jgi:hypothetical protein